MDSIPAPNVSLTVNVADEFTAEEQWVFLFHLEGNQLSPLDSCYIKAGEKRFVFHGFVDKEDTSCWVTFSKNGPPITSFIYFNPGDELEMDIVSEWMRHPVTGSLTNELEYDWFTTSVAIRKKTQELEKVLGSLEEDEGLRRAEIEEEIKELIYYLNIGKNLEYLKNTPSPTYYRTTLHYLLKQHLSEEDFEELVLEMKRRFPNDEKVQMYPDYKPSPPATEESKYWWERYHKMYEENLGKTESSADGTLLFQSNFVGEYFDITTTIPDADGNEVSLSEITTPYILVDFWAAWCAPCRREIPHLKKALEKFDGEFTVYAISLDDDRDAWLEAIETDDSGEFVQVLLGYNNPESKALLGKYGIGAIPANFLLGPDRKVIAVGLRGEQVEEKLEELLK